MSKFLFFYLFLESIITFLIYFNFLIMLKFSQNFEEFKKIFLIIFPSILIYSFILYFNFKYKINIVKKKGCKIILYLFGILLTLFIEWVSFVEICVFGMNEIFYCNLQIFLMILIIFDFIILLSLKIKSIKNNKKNKNENINNEKFECELKYKKFSKNSDLENNENNEISIKENLKVL